MFKGLKSDYFRIEMHASFEFIGRDKKVKIRLF